MIYAATPDYQEVTMATQETPYVAHKVTFMPMHPVTRFVFRMYNRIADTVYALRGELRPPVKLY